MPKRMFTSARMFRLGSAAEHTLPKLAGLPTTADDSERRCIERMLIAPAASAKNNATTAPALWKASGRASRPVPRMELLRLTMLLSTDAPRSAEGEEDAATSVSSSVDFSDDMFRCFLRCEVQTFTPQFCRFLGKFLIIRSPRAEAHASCTEKSRHAAYT